MGATCHQLCQLMLAYADGANLHYATMKSFAASQLCNVALKCHTSAPVLEREVQLSKGCKYSAGEVEKVHAHRSTPWCFFDMVVVVLANIFHIIVVVAPAHMSIRARQHPNIAACSAGWWRKKQSSQARTTRRSIDKYTHTVTRLFTLGQGPYPGLKTPAQAFLPPLRERPIDSVRTSSLVWSTDLSE